VLSQILIFASAAIVCTLGAIHLIYTFASDKFLPRDLAIAQQMKQVAPVISKQTTMWRAWIGFNASHSLGAILFGVVYGYLAMVHFQFLLQAKFLLLVGALFLGSFVLLAKRYWFTIPFVGITISTVLFLAGSALAMA
jgi:hypothetical protein